jgi:hypothetical protein
MYLQIMGIEYHIMISFNFLRMKWEQVKIIINLKIGKKMQLK